MNTLLGFPETHTFGRLLRQWRTTRHMSQLALALPNGFQDGHSSMGLMRPSWDRDDFQRAERGQLRFDSGQASLIRRSLRD